MSLLAVWRELVGKEEEWVEARSDITSLIYSPTTTMLMVE